MKQSKPFIFLMTLSFYFLSTGESLAATRRLSGMIRDEHKQPLPYVTIYVEGTTKGTTSNIEGEYFLDLDPGEYQIIFRLIGYKQVKEPISIGVNPVIKDVQLIPESYQLKEVSIKADAEDPAYAIIRNAQKKRKFFLDQVESFQSNAYVKSTQKLLSYPKKVLGQDVQIEEFVDTATQIFYLSESVSKLSFKRPEKIKEEMISSKVSGNPRSYSFNQAADLMLSFYENLVEINGLTPRGIVSPISGNALFYYNYKLEGTYLENDQLVNKIKVIPKRKNDPVFTGDIYIVEDSWRIHSADLFITKNQQIEFIDTFRIRQNFVSVTPELWMPFSNELNFEFRALGFHGVGSVLGVFSSYVISPEFKNGFFSGQVMKVEKEANKKDSAYWMSVRPVPLTKLEETDYHRKDSTRIVYESKPYRDSLDKVNNKFKAGSLLNGYTWERSYKDKSFSFSSLPEDVQYNTVEGWVAHLSVRYRKGFGNDDRRELIVKPEIRYGFSNLHWNGFVEGSYRYNTFKLAVLSAKAGTDVVQFNPAKPISPLINTLYSLIACKNFMKMYERRFFQLAHRHEIRNGLNMGVQAELAQRLPLINTNIFSFASDDSRKFTSNDPLNPASDYFHFSTNESFIAELTFRIRIRQEYADRPEGKFIIGSRYPTLWVNYRKGFPVAGSDVDFDYLSVSAEDEMNLGLFGHLNYVVTASDFLSVKKIFFMDFKHFNGNKTWLSGFSLSEFKNLDYYTYSTTDASLEAHGELNLGGFILNKIPLIRKFKLNEIVGLHYLKTNVVKNYLELSFGIEKFGAFRAELFTSFAQGKRGNIGFLFGIKRNIGLQ
ncbi:MAG: carboxypeptidase-like regulatory domain-containing protein [Bacteroidetes bacterium]|nr:carboxypeptidase-like regulatory domain-containing protein [Bacteroidota bacterium]